MARNAARAWLVVALVVLEIHFLAARGLVSFPRNGIGDPKRTSGLRKAEQAFQPPILHPNVQREFPPCAPMIFTMTVLDIGQMLEVCAKSIPSPLMPPSYYARVNVTQEATNVSVQLVLNSLILLDDIQSQYTIDFFIRVMWRDPRIEFDDEAWDHINPEARSEGLEISDFIRTAGSVYIWLPDIFFFEANELAIVDELIKLLPGGNFYWSRHFVGTFNEPEMPFNEYPVDSQNLSLTLQSFSYSSKFISLSFINNQAVELTVDMHHPEKLGLNGNKLWEFVGYHSAASEQSFPSPKNPERAYSTAYVSLLFRRRYLGIVYRLALPILIFMIVAGASFWMNEDWRINITLQMMMAISTIYIIIGRAIPFIGYVTPIDVYMISLFATLAATILLHFSMNTMSRKANKYPMTKFYSVAILIFFRAVWIPMAVTLFTLCFGPSHTLWVTVCVTLAAASFVYMALHSHYIQETFRASLIKLRMKADLIKLGALDEATGRKMVLATLEKPMLYLTRNLYTDDKYKKLMFSSELAQLDEGGIMDDGGILADAADEDDEVIELADLEQGIGREDGGKGVSFDADDDHDRDEHYAKMQKAEVVNRHLGGTFARTTCTALTAYMEEEEEEEEEEGEDANSAEQAIVEEESRDREEKEGPMDEEGKLDIEVSPNLQASGKEVRRSSHAGELATPSMEGSDPALGRGTRMSRMSVRQSPSRSMASRSYSIESLRSVPGDATYPYHRIAERNRSRLPGMRSRRLSRVSNSVISSPGRRETESTSEASRSGRLVRRIPSSSSCDVQSVLRDLDEHEQVTEKDLEAIAQCKRDTLHTMGAVLTQYL